MPDLSFETTIPVRFQDFDLMGHVNNAVYATYLEEARTTYINEALGIPTEEINCVLAHLELDFHAPLQETAAVTVAVGVTDVGEKSVTRSYEVRDGGETYATAETVLVTLDPATGRPTELTDPWLAGIREQEGSLPGRD